MDVHTYTYIHARAYTHIQRACTVNFFNLTPTRHGSDYQIFQNIEQYPYSLKYLQVFFLAYYAWPWTPSTKVTRKERNPWRQHVHRATRPRSYAIDKVWEAQKIVSRQKHNMLSLLHAACLKLLVFFSLCLLNSSEHWINKFLKSDKWNANKIIWVHSGHDAHDELWKRHT